MSKYEKRSNRYYRKINASKKIRKKLGRRKVKELKTITIEFRSGKEKDLYVDPLLETLEAKGVKKYFTRYSQQSSRVFSIFTEPKNPCVGGDYKQLAIDMLENISKSDIAGKDYIYCLFKLYTRKGKQHLYIAVNITDKQQRKNYNLLPGIESWFTVYPYEYFGDSDKVPDYDEDE